MTICKEGCSHCHRVEARVDIRHTSYSSRSRGQLGSNGSGNRATGRAGYRAHFTEVTTGERSPTAAPRIRATGLSSVEIAR